MIDSRFALLSHILPPSPSGQAVALYRILSGLPKDRYYLIRSRVSPENVDAEENLFQLRSQCYVLPAESLLSRPRHFRLSYLRNKINLLLQIYIRAKNIADVLQREPATQAVIACSGDFADIPAGALASKRSGIPFYAYIFDDYVFQWMGSQRWMARLMAPFLFKSAAGIIGPNEFICEEYHHRYGVQTRLVRNPSASEQITREPCLEWPAENGAIQIVYTGAIYHANADCFRNLVRAVESLSEYPLEIHIFSAQTREELASQGIQSEKLIIHSHLPYGEVLERQRKADILFLPLAFESPIPQVIRTSAPGKLGEYLASGRPVLAHVPSGSFVAYYFKKYQCGFVVDQNDANLLAMQIKELIAIPSGWQEMVRNARRQARLDFSPEIAQDQLKALLQIGQ